MTNSITTIIAGTVSTIVSTNCDDWWWRYDYDDDDDGDDDDNGDGDDDDDVLAWLEINVCVCVCVVLVLCACVSVFRSEYELESHVLVAEQIARYCRNNTIKWVKHSWAVRVYGQCKFIYCLYGFRFNIDIFT